MIDNVFNIIAEFDKETKKCIYLSADVHNFQLLTISRNGYSLPIVVCGTVGAEPDTKELEDCHSSEIMLQQVVNEYTVQVHMIAPSYGFTIIVDNIVTYYTFNNERYASPDVQDYDTLKGKIINTNIPLDKYKDTGCSIVLASKPPKPSKKSKHGGRRSVIIE